MNTQTAPTPLLAWEAPTTMTHVRSSRWYLIGGSLVVAGAAWSILSGDWSFALALLLIGVVYFLLRNAPVVLHRMVISEQGFSLDDTFTRWDDCRDFWIVQVPTHWELHIARVHLRWGGQETVIQTGDIDIETLRAVLSQFLQERSGQKEHLTDALIRILKL